jgi:AbrB family looped-hinge helix DNA binding protein
MENVNIIRMSSKGQVVIPQDMRIGIKEGDKLLVIKNKDQIILKKADKMGKNFAEDIEFAKRTEDAWKEYEKGKFKKMDFDDFIKEMKKW